jgi:hypothetical protein
MQSLLRNALPLAVAGLLAWPSLAPAGYPYPMPGPGPSHPPAGKTLLTWKAMYGVGGPFVGDANPQRGVAGDSLPWVLKSATGSLTTGGHLRISVKGLVFPNSVLVPVEKRGINDETQFRALVSCVTVVGSDVQVQNVKTTGFAASPKGNSQINAWIALPDPCLEPAVFILAGAEDVWFASTGFISAPE